MKCADAVVYLARRDWGLGVVESIEPCIVVSFETPDGLYVGEFGEGELELATRVTATA